MSEKSKWELGKLGASFMYTVYNDVKRGTLSVKRRMKVDATSIDRLIDWLRGQAVDWLIHRILFSRFCRSWRRTRKLTTLGNFTWQKRNCEWRRTRWQRNWSFDGTWHGSSWWLTIKDWCFFCSLTMLVSSCLNSNSIVYFCDNSREIGLFLMHAMLFEVSLSKFYRYF